MHPATATNRNAPGSMILAVVAVAGACYLLLIITLRASADSFWIPGVACILGVPPAVGAGLAFGWNNLRRRPFRLKNTLVFVLADVALMIYIAFWVIARTN